MSQPFWKSLEMLPGLAAVPAVWKEYLQESFPAFQTLCLQPSPELLTHLPCPNDCGCDHFIIQRHDHSGAIAACCCNPPRCPDIPLTLPEITPLKLDWIRLGHAICKAFGCQVKISKLTPLTTVQIGSWSVDAVPVILTIQIFQPDLLSAVGQLAATLRRPFILFAPTSSLLDARCQAILETCGAAFFPLNANVILTEHGTLHAAKVPGELFARFTPQPKELDDSVARRAFSLVRQLDIESRMKSPTILTVFRLYCIEEMSISQLARKCRCATGTIAGRLALIRAKIGMDPRALRQTSSHLASLETSISDPRAAHIHRKNLIANDLDP